MVDVMNLFCIVLLMGLIFMGFYELYIKLFIWYCDIDFDWVVIGVEVGCFNV